MTCPTIFSKNFFFCQKSYGNTTRLKILNTIKKKISSISGHFRRFTPRPSKSSVAVSRYVPNTFSPTIFFQFLWVFLPSFFWPPFFFHFFWGSFFYPHLLFFYFFVFFNPSFVFFSQSYLWLTVTVTVTGN